MCQLTVVESMIFLAFFSLPMWQNVFEEEKVEANEQKEGTTGLAVRRDGCGDNETEFEFEEAEALLVSGGVQEGES